jgi:hypothetical protein
VTRKFVGVFVKDFAPLHKGKYLVSIAEKLYKLKTIQMGKKTFKAFYFSEIF